MTNQNSSTEVRDLKAALEAAKAREASLFRLHYGHVVATNGQPNKYAVDKYSFATQEEALEAMAELAAKHSGNGLRELILVFPK